MSTPVTASQTPGRMSKLAVIALIFSCIFFLPLIPLIGAILGIVGASTIRPPTRGKGLAIAAIPVGFSMAFFIQGILAAVAIPAFINYMKRAKTREAQVTLSEIQQGAATFAGQQAAPGFPVAATDWTPQRPCCSQGKACRVTPAEWSVPPWSDLGFTPEQKHHFQWRYESDGAALVAEARADLDCDGIYSSYLLSGSIIDGQPTFEEIAITDELE